MIFSQPQPTYPCTYVPSLVHLSATATQDHMSHTRPLTSASCQGKERVSTPHRISSPTAKAHTTTFPQPSHHVDTQKPQARLPRLTVLITYCRISHALLLARACSPFADDDRTVCLPRRCCRVGAASRVEHITRSGARSLLGHSRRAEETGRVGHSSRGPRAFGSNLHRRHVDCSRS
jgi:hypothetical protein